MGRAVLPGQRPTGELVTFKIVSREVNVLNDYERRTLHEVERDIGATDPELAAFLHDGQRRLPHTLSNLGYDATMVLLTLLFVLLLLRLPASALVVAALAGGLWWLRGQREQRNAGRDSR